MQSHSDRLADCVAVEVVEFDVALWLLRLNHLSPLHSFSLNTYSFLAFLLYFFCCFLNPRRFNTLLNLNVIVTFALRWGLVVIVASVLGAFRPCLRHFL